MKDSRDPEQVGHAIKHLMQTYNMSACDAADTLLSGLATPEEDFHPVTERRTPMFTAVPTSYVTTEGIEDSSGNGPPEIAPDGPYPLDYME